MTHQFAVFNDTLNLVAQCEVFHALPHISYQAHKAVQGSESPRGQELLPRTFLCRLPHGQTAFAGLQTQYRNSLLANATGRCIDHTLECGIVIRVLNQPQIGQCILDFCPLEKSLPAIYTIGNGCLEQIFFEQP